MIDIEKFMKDGWVVVDMPDWLEYPQVEEYSHALNTINDAELKSLHVNSSKALWNRKYSFEVARAIIPLISQLIGLDVMVQYYPYFRIARPNKPQDNIGYHKDTQYGQTPYELAVHIPFVDLDEKSALRVISGSHLIPESAFQVIPSDEPHIEKGSIENQTGRPYAPKRLAVPEGMVTTPMCVKVGQAAIFSPALFHGQEVNEGDITRVSCDLRFVSALHADKVRVGKVHAGYVSVSESPVNKLATMYYEAQK